MIVGMTPTTLPRLPRRATLICHKSVPASSWTNVGRFVRVHDMLGMDIHLQERRGLFVASHRAVIIFGKSEILEGIRSIHTDASLDRIATAEVVLANETLANTVIEYQSFVRIAMISDVDCAPIFAGIVEEVIPARDETAIRLVAERQRLYDTLLRGGIMVDLPGAEVLWSIAIHGGAANRILVDDFIPGPVEPFHVVVPVDGVNIEGKITIGEVALFPSDPASTWTNAFRDWESWEIYSGASAWASITLDAHTVIEAERTGLQAIEVALAWLTACARYSLPALPGALPRRFRRSWLQSGVWRRDVVVVRGTVTNRRWIRIPTDKSSTPVLDTREIPDLTAIDLPVPHSAQMREALAAWRRAVEGSDPLATVVSLWQAIEFYAAEITSANTTTTFTKAENKAILKAATSGLTGHKRDRVAQVLAMLNGSSALHQLREALRVDGVPYTEAEFSLLKELRDVRNNFVHGRPADAPEEQDARHAKALVNRMLVYRLHRLSKDVADT